MEHILTGPYNKPTNNSRRPPRGAYGSDTCESVIGGNQNRWSGDRNQ
ncbi:MAG: hypothetical protein ACMX3H_18510 [Sodalis sp. (in: enterobacteria)]